MRSVFGRFILDCGGSVGTTLGIKQSAAWTNSALYRDHGRGHGNVSPQKEEEKYFPPLIFVPSLAVAHRQNSPLLRSNEDKKVRESACVRERAEREKGVKHTG